MQPDYPWTDDDDSWWQQQDNELRQMLELIETSEHNEGDET